jgi:hypothetical protein
MTFCSLDCLGVRIDNHPMTSALRPRYSAALVLAATLLMTACSGVSSGPQSQTPGSTSGTLAVSPSALNFGNVAVGNSSSLSGTLSATSTDVVVSSAAWNGSGYSVSGISFPVTIPAGKSANYMVTFTPPAAGASSGNISFMSDASDASLNQSFSGNGTQTSAGHSVVLTWSPSTSTVIGYNVYRSVQSGGPYSRLNSALLSGTSYTDGSVQSGGTYYYVSTAISSNNAESAYSNQAIAIIP